MALPKSTDTPRLRYLHALVQSATEGGWADWPMLNDRDYTQIGKIVVLYSYIDVNIRRIVEAAENAGCLNAPWKGSVRKLRIGEAEEAVLSLDWSESNEQALKHIADRRATRNLIAHFAVRRFPNDDAYLFFTKSDQDYKQLYGVDPEPGTVMTAVMECAQINDAFKHIQALQLWISKATAEAEKLFINLKLNI